MALPSAFGSTKLSSATAGEPILDDGDLNFSTHVVSLTDDDDTATTLPLAKGSFYVVSRTGVETSTIDSTIIIPDEWSNPEFSQTDNRNTGFRLRIHFTGGSTSLIIQFNDDESITLGAGKTVEVIYAPSLTDGLIIGEGSATLTPIRLYLLAFGG